MSVETFTKCFSKPDPIPKKARSLVEDILLSGDIFRYQSPQNNVVAAAEIAFADYVGVKYALGMNSGGCALFLALKTIFGLCNENEIVPKFLFDKNEKYISQQRQGIKKNGTEAPAVLTNAWTLIPVPGAILHAGARPILVDCDKSTFSICIEDLYRKQEKYNARYFMLSYMRGRVPNMDEIMKFCEERKIILIEDCAHTLGSRWKGKMLGTFGQIGCFSCQTNKLINAGEGGFLVTNNDDIIAKAIVGSGSYGYYFSHASRPQNLLIFDETHYNATPNFSMRMNNITGTLVKAQIPDLGRKIELFNIHWYILQSELSDQDTKNKFRIHVAPRYKDEFIVGTSFQFNVLLAKDKEDTQEYHYKQLEKLSDRLIKRGISNAWFGRDLPKGFTSTYRHWLYCRNDVGSVDEFKKSLTKTKEMLFSMFDIPLYHTSTWTDEDFKLIANIIKEEVTALDSELNDLKNSIKSKI